MTLFNGGVDDSCGLDGLLDLLLLWDDTRSLLKIETFAVVAPSEATFSCERSETSKM